MANNKINVDVVVDDKGSLKETTRRSKQAAKSLNDLGNETQNFDRKMKGASQATSNGTKAFSKMAQGGGGIAGIYAQIAAQVFAVSAAFQFLRNAADVSKLIKGQEALGSVTGVAYKSITNSIQEATGAQINYREAAQAAAIGTAAGLSSSQLERIGSAAKNASAALGRDLTDSFNRLVRGITKAEPELLDELGIILRLKSATEKYAKAIGKNVNDLNAFERSQAVANEVLGQAEEKYGKLEKLMSSSGTNALNQFLVSFDKLFINVQKFATETMAPVFKFLTRNTESFIVLLGALSAIIVKSLIPDFGAWGQSADENLKRQVKRMASYRLELKKTAKQAQASLTIQQGAAQKSSSAAQALAATKGITGTTGGKKGFDFILGDINDKSKAGMRAAEAMFQNIETRYDKHGKVVSGKLKGLTRSEVATFNKALQDRKKYLKTLEVAHSNTYGKMDLRVKKYVAKTKLAFASLQAATATVFGAISKGLNKAFSFFGTIGLIVSIGTMLFSLGKEVYRFFNPISAEAQKAADAISSFSEKTATLNEELERMGSVRSSVSLTLKEIVSQIGQAASSASLPQLAEKILHFRTLASEGLIDEKTLSTQEKAFEETLGLVAKLDKNLLPVLKRFQDTKEIDLKELFNFDANARRAAASVKAFSRGLSDVKDGLDKIAGTAAKSPFEDVRRNLQLARVEGVRLVNEMERANSDEQKRLDAEIKRLKTRLEKGTESVTTTERDFGPGIGSQWKSVTREVALTATAMRNTREQYDKAVERAQNLTAEQKKTRTELTNIVRMQAILNQLSDQYLANEKAILKNKNDFARNQVLEYTTLDKINNKNLQIQIAENPLLKAKNKLLAANGALEAASAGSDMAKLSNATKAQRAAQSEYDTALAKYGLTKDQLNLELDILNIQNKHNKDQLDKDQTILNLKKQQFSVAQKEANLQKQLNKFKQQAITLAATEKMQQRRVNSTVGTYVFNSAELGEKDRIFAERKINDLKMQQANADKTIAIAKLNLEKSQFTLAQKRLALELAVLNRKRNVKTTREDGLTDEQGALFDGINTASTTAFTTQGTAIEAAFMAASKAIQSANVELDISEKNLQTITQLANTAAKSFETGLGDAFNNIITDTKSVSEAFSDMASSILQSMSKIVANKIAAQIIGSLFSAGATSDVFAGGPEIDALGNVGGPYHVRYGGVLNSSGKIPGYAVGGIASGPQAGYPVELHGTEAVVPLPNGKSIPVEMKNSAGQVNNINVSVQVDGNGNSNVESGEGGEGLGKAIAAAVQKELQNQKRSGGILNPYGAT